jgi:DNA-directed RNA polymerase subunit F
MLPRPDPTTIDTIKHAADLLSGAARRTFQAQTVLDHCNGNLSHAKTLFGWHQETLRRALLEREKGEPLPDRTGRGRKRIADLLPNLQNDIRSLVDPSSCTHPTFDNTFRYTRMTAQAVLDALIRDKGYPKNELPALSTMRELLGKMGYRLRRVQKTKPQKKFPRRTQSSPT